MSTKIFRLVTALIVIVGITGNTGVVHAGRSTPPNLSVQNLELLRAPEPQHPNTPALAIPPVSSLGVQFVHIATAANIYASYTTIIDHP